MCLSLCSVCSKQMQCGKTKESHMAKSCICVGFLFCFTEGSTELQGVLRPLGMDPNTETWPISTAKETVVGPVLGNYDGDFAGFCEAYYLYICVELEFRLG